MHLVARGRDSIRCVSFHTLGCSSVGTCFVLRRDPQWLSVHWHDGGFVAINFESWAMLPTHGARLRISRAVSVRPNDGRENARHVMSRVTVNPMTRIQSGFLRIVSRIRFCGPCPADSASS
jgi:hypothetical protein